MSLGDIYVSPDQSRRQLVAQFYKDVVPLLASGAIKIMAIENIGGLDKIKAGLERMVAGQYSGVRLVASW